MFFFSAIVVVAVFVFFFFFFLFFIWFPICGGVILGFFFFFFVCFSLLFGPRLLFVALSPPTGLTNEQSPQHTLSIPAPEPAFLPLLGFPLCATS